MSEAPVPIGLVPIILLIKPDNITPSTIDSVLSSKDNFCAPDLPGTRIRSSDFIPINQPVHQTVLKVLSAALKEIKNSAPS